MTADIFPKALLLIEHNLSDIKRDVAAVEVRLDLLETRLTTSFQAIEIIWHRFQAAGK
jgi:hypothetical protein